jgi:hypothetical protein
MRGKRRTKESIIQTLQGLASNLGRTTLGKADVQRVLPLSSVNNHFGSLGKALKAAGLQCRSPGAHLKDHGCVLPDDELFESIYCVEQNLGHEPGANEYNAEGKYSIKPFKKRFGARWGDALAHYRKWKVERGDGGTAIRLFRLQPYNDGKDRPNNHFPVSTPTSLSRG